MSFCFLIHKLHAFVSRRVLKYISPSVSRFSTITSFYRVPYVIYYTSGAFANFLVDHRSVNNNSPPICQ